MDWKTHLILAGKLLKSCSLPIGGCIYSLLPAIDIEPLAFHRQYAHVLANQTLILDAAKEIYGMEEFKRRDFNTLRHETDTKLDALKARLEKLEGGNATKIEKRSARNRIYFYKRVAETAEGFVNKELSTAAKILGKEAEDVSTDLATAAVSIVSHTYFDMFNNPVSVFYPYAPNYAAHWSFWEEIDYLDFKETFYEEDNITEFREKMWDSSVWVTEVDPTAERDPIIRERIEKELGKPYNPYALVKAMIERLGDLAPGISYEAVDRTVRDFLAYLGCKEIIHSDRERLFLLNVEREIKRLIYEKYGKRR
jgi:hypothetical protein